MLVRPRDRLSLCFKKSVDHNGLELASGSSACASCFATNNRRSGVNRGACAIREDNFTAVRNSLGIDGTMSGAQSCTRARIFPGLSLAYPVTGNTRKDRLLARESGRCQQ